MCTLRRSMPRQDDLKKKRTRKLADLERLDDPDFKYELYEASVQDPDGDVDRCLAFYDELVGGKPEVLREDFCGTFKISCSWVKKKRSHRAVGLDLDPEPLASGRRRHWTKLDADQQARLDIRQADVRTATEPAADIALAGNFSSFIFKTTDAMLAYLKAVHASLADDGILLLEIAGGPGMTETCEESRAVFKNDRKWFSYVWDQQRFDPITHDALYAIHFDLKGGHRIEEAFTYDWRLWTIPELRELLLRAGFVDTAVYWEKEDEDGEGNGEYRLATSAPNDIAFLSYVVGLKSPRRRVKKKKSSTGRQKKVKR